MLTQQRRRFGLWLAWFMITWLSHHLVLSHLPPPPAVELGHFTKDAIAIFAQVALMMGIGGFVGSTVMSRTFRADADVAHGCALASMFAFVLGSATRH